MARTLDWGFVRANLRPGEVIRTWGLARGWGTASFKIAEVTPALLRVSGSGIAGNGRAVSRTDFEKLLACWDDYLKGRIGRQEMRSQSFNATYIISILKHLSAE